MAAPSSSESTARAVVPVTPGVARGQVAPPGSKSATHRALVLAYLGGRAARVEGLLLAEDSRQVLFALATLGWSVELVDGAAARPLQPPSLLPGAAGRDGELWEWHRAAGQRPVVRLVPGPPPREAVIDCGAAGTMYRLFAALLTTVPGRFVLDGVPRLRERPIAPLVEALQALGADIRYLVEPGGAPLGIRGPSLGGGRTRLDAGASSQYLSALLLAGQSAKRPIEIVVEALTSAPYVALTVAAIRRAGGVVDEEGGEVDRGAGGPRIYRTRPTTLDASDQVVEADWSAACYPAAAAALTGGAVDMVGLDPHSLQGDRGFLSVLSAMGAEVSWRQLAVGGGAVCEVRGGGGLVAIDADLSAMPDQVPTLAALAPFAAGTTRIRGVAHLRLKESDRLAAMRRELGRLGVAVEELADGLRIPGVWADHKPPDELVTCAVDDDHRIAMSLALVGLRRPGVVIAEPAVVAKSYPAFWRDLAALVGSPQ